MDRQVAQRYAQALYDLANEQHHLDDVHADLYVLERFISSSVECQQLMYSTVMSSEERLKVVHAAFKKHLHSLTFIFILFLEEKNRLDHLELVASVFQELYLHSKNTISVEVTSAIQLSAQQVEQMAVQLKRRFHKDIESHFTVDPTLIGGFRIQIGDQVINNSISFQLNKFKKELIHHAN